ncbi:SOS response-associated peptidase family protein [Luteimonas yindakuii]|uniref:SOS response-associated peptidase family protein n=1 Tax=Luteimonas yindakuii TaxID=2565782 RepID=UPI003134344A
MYSKASQARSTTAYSLAAMARCSCRRAAAASSSSCATGAAPPAKPSFYDTKYPGTYNARRDNLEGYWRGQFGQNHGLMIADRFYEHVKVDGVNTILEFEPRTCEPMLVPCLWSSWSDPKGVEPDLLSFAAITDDPEPEVAATGHDRTPINMKPEHVEAWLNPDPSNLEALYAMFDDKRHPYYEYREAA